MTSMSPNPFWETHSLRTHVNADVIVTAAAFQTGALPGAALMCQAGDEWHVVGVAAKPANCSASAFDKMVDVSQWAKATMAEMGGKTGKPAQPEKNDSSSSTRWTLLTIYSSFQ